MPVDVRSGDRTEELAAYGLEDEAETQELAAAPGSALEALRRRVEEAKETVAWTVEIPYTQIVATYKPIDEADFKRIVRRGAQSGEVDVDMASKILGWCCAGLKDDVSGEELGTFASHPVWEAFAVPNAPAAVRAIYPTDGWVIGHARKLVEFSGFTGEELGSAIRGN